MTGNPGGERMKLASNMNLPSWLIWHITAVAAIVLIPSVFILGKPVWALPGNQTALLAGIAISYLLSALVLVLLTGRGKSIQLRDLVLVVFAIFGAYFLFLLMTGSYVSRPILLATFVLSVVFILLSFNVAGAIRNLLVIFVACIAILSQLMHEPISDLTSSPPEPYRSQKLIDTGFYTVRATIFNNEIDGCPRAEKRCGIPKTTGGGLAIFADGYLLATGKGDLYSLTYDSQNRQLETSLLPYRIPLNSDAFKADNGDADLWLYRVTDILLQDQGDSFRLFAAHHHWKADRLCSVLRISTLEGNYAEFLAGDTAGEWKTVYETKPCLPITKGRKGDGFKGGDSGGRMALLNDSQLLFTVGDYQHDGWNREEMLPQIEDAEYGKTILIDLETGDSSIYSSGHRNPQGLYVSREGRIWSTEHGPRGGDELNIVTEGVNYGWPLVTYGTEYGDKQWPLSSSQGQHEGFQRPVYSWVPSIAVSNLIGVEGDMFPLWKDDLLVASYKQSLWRLRIRENRVIYAEPVTVLQRNGRIRDLMEDRDGRIMLWFDSGSIAILEPLDTGSDNEDTSGEVLFVQCTGCHNVDSGKTGKRGKTPTIGPDLLGISGRTIAGLPGYSYSQGLGNRAGTWSRDNLDAFLRSPQDFAPGNKMEFAGIADAGDREKLIQYLSTLK
jgi:glucose/arabinose dehydrogenase